MSLAIVLLILLAGLMSLVAYTLAHYARTRAPLGIALPETGVVWAAAIGVVFFKKEGLGDHGVGLRRGEDSAAQSDLAVSTRRR